MEILDYMERHGHEQVVVCNEPDVGLRAYIAIHDTTLGPACGGVRIWPHPSEDAALTDVLRLSKAMTYKSALAGLSLGGGKGLIVADSRTDKTEELLRAFGKYVETLGGRYVTTEDVGMTPGDLEHVAKETDHVAGLPQSLGGSGDTSVLTGLGVYLGIKASAMTVWDSDNLDGRVVAIQGFGNVGRNLATHLIEDGVKLVVTDIYKESLIEAQSIGASIVAPDEIYDVDCDIFSPCALGGVLNTDTIPRLRCSIVAGGANNQLLENSAGEELHRRRILYAPDFVINAGGIINVSCEIGDVYRPERAYELTQRIGETTKLVFQTAKDGDIPTSVAADRLAEDRIESVRKLKSIY